jgi:hypothetical protein
VGPPSVNQRRACSASGSLEDASDDPRVQLSVAACRIGRHQGPRVL